MFTSPKSISLQGDVEEFQSDTYDVLKNIAAQYYDITKLKPNLFLQSSPGALEFGTIEMQID